MNLVGGGPAGVILYEVRKVYIKRAPYVFTWTLGYGNRAEVMKVEGCVLGVVGGRLWAAKMLTVGVISYGCGLSKNYNVCVQI